MPPSPHDPTLPPLSPELAAARADTLRPAEQVALIRDDQRRQWQGGHRVLTEAYLVRFPDLAGDTDTVLQLLTEEFRLRTELGERPTVEEYARRFPSHGRLLRRRLAEVPVQSQADTVRAKPAATTQTLEYVSRPDNLETTPVQPRLPKSARADIPMPTVPGYDLLGELGRGAMGVVYRARQKALGREVALKMVLSGQFAGRHELERFRVEAVQLAKLQHANIVQIYEVGEFDGRPYLALEYVPGGTLSKVLETKPLAPRPAAELAETLARASHHAHERGIIHRDLKPGNILLAADGAPKITDFGLAKGEGSMGDTASYAVLGTPSYMAPEQASGQSRDVGPPADVYALGSILYEALTGRPPFRAASLLDTIQLVTTTEPVPPGDLTVNLPRDLETITLKCLQKEPAKRYTSAADLADDLRRFLDGQPIKARPVSVVEKAWKWAKRRPAWAALAATVVLAAAGLAGTGVWFNSQLRHERDIARTERDRANEAAALAEQRFQQNREAIDRYFTGVSEGDLLDEPGMQPLREKLLGLAKDYYARFVEERRDDPTVRADLARSISRLARISADLKDPREAIKLHLQALPIFQELAAATPDDLAPRADVAGTWYELSRLYRMTRQSAEAAAACSTAVDLWTKLAAARPLEPKYRSELARSWTSQSNLDFELNRLGPARVACDQSLAIRQTLAAERPADRFIARDLGTTWDNLANIRAVAGEWTESHAARRKAADVFRKLVADHPFRPLYRNDLARVQFNLGTDLLRTGPPQPAAAAIPEAVEQWDRLHALHPAVREYHVSLANALFALAQAEWASGRAADGDAALGKAKAVRTDLVNQYPAVPEYAAELARCEAADGDNELRRNQPAAAADAFKRAADRLAALAEKHPDVPRYRADLALDRLNHGKALALAGQYEPARAAMKAALQVWEGLHDDPTVGGEAQVRRLEGLHAIGDVERRAGDPVKALEWFDRCLADGEALARRTPPVPGVAARLRDAWWAKAQALTTLARYPDAVAAWDHAVALAEGDVKVFVSIYRLGTLARTVEYERALTDLDLLAGRVRVSGSGLFEVARVYALAARTAATDAKQPETDRDHRAREAGDRAIEHLRLARARDYFATASARGALATDADFEAVRGRADFQKLLAEVNDGARP